MRIHHSVLIALVAALGCGEGKECTPACDDDHRCIDGVCEPCGDPGETCCMKASFFQCNEGIACDNTGKPICTTDCGLPGLPCCDGSCYEGLCGDSNTCVGSCGSGDTVHTFTEVDAWGCAWDTHTFNSGPSGIECAQTLLAAIDPNKNYHLGPLDTLPQCMEVCSNVNDPFGTYTLCAFSDQELASCEVSQCQDCTWTDGKCPGAP